VEEERVNVLHVDWIEGFELYNTRRRAKVNEAGFAVLERPLKLGEYGARDRNFNLRGRRRGEHTELASRWPHDFEKICLSMRRHGNAFVDCKMCWC
jgi:hypothetical protein